MRMFSPKGNPNLDTLADVLKELARREGYVVRVEQPAAPRRASARTPRARKSKLPRNVRAVFFEGLDREIADESSQRDPP